MDLLFVVCAVCAGLACLGAVLLLCAVLFRKRLRESGMGYGLTLAVVGAALLLVSIPVGLTFGYFYQMTI